MTHNSNIPTNQNIEGESHKCQSKIAASIRQPEIHFQRASFRPYNYRTNLSLCIMKLVSLSIKRSANKHAEFEQFKQLKHFLQQLHAKTFSATRRNCRQSTKTSGPQRSKTTKPILRTHTITKLIGSNHAPLDSRKIRGQEPDFRHSKTRSNFNLGVLL